MNNDNIEKICRAICAARNLDPDKQVYQDGGSGYLMPQWMEFKDTVEIVLLVLKECK